MKGSTDSAGWWGALGDGWEALGARLPGMEKFSVLQEKRASQSHEQ